MTTPDFSTALSSPTHWLVVVVTLVMVACCIGLHYEVLDRLNNRMPRWRLLAHRRVLALMFVIFAVHVVEIWIFGLGLHLIIQQSGAGSLIGASDPKLLDAVYLSATSYSTLGYGDLAPLGPIRFVLGTEALLGLLLITWSASFTYLEMDRYWRSR